MRPTMISTPGSAAVSTVRKAPAAPSQRAGSQFTIVPVRAEEELLAHVDAWDDLGRHALEPNVFFEPWFLLPAVRAFGGGQNLLFAFIYEKRAQAPEEAPTLVGFVPMVEHLAYK